MPWHYSNVFKSMTQENTTHPDKQVEDKLDPYAGLDDDSAEMKDANMTWGKVGDYIMGTLVDVKRGIDTQYGLNDVYIIMAKEGEYHETVKDKDGNKVLADKPTPISESDYMSVWGRTKRFNDQMERIRIGQILCLKLREIIPSKKESNQPFKRIAIYTKGVIDPNFTQDTAKAVQDTFEGSEEVDVEDVPFTG